jgi:hypothetical protein
MDITPTIVVRVSSVLRVYALELRRCAELVGRFIPQWFTVDRSATAATLAELDAAFLRLTLYADAAARAPTLPAHECAAVLSLMTSIDDVLVSRRRPFRIAAWIDCAERDALTAASVDFNKCWSTFRFVTYYAPYGADIAAAAATLRAPAAST